MNTSKLIEDELYQMLTQRAVKDEKWAAYFLLVNACYDIAKSVPTTEEAAKEADIEKLLIHALEQIGIAIYEVLPGGAEEFYHYMPCSHQNMANH